jgi:hypothetical protein
MKSASLVRSGKTAAADAVWLDFGFSQFLTAVFLSETSSSVFHSRENRVVAFLSAAGFPPPGSRQPGEQGEQERLDRERKRAMAGNKWRIGGNGAGRPFAKHGTESGQGWTINGHGTTSLVPIGTPVIPDWLAHLAGPIRWNTRDFSLLTPIDREAPAVPEGYVDGFQVPLLFKGFTLAEFTSSSEYAGSAFFSLRWIYAMAPEAEQGMLLVYVVEKSEAIYNASRGQTFHKPVLKATDRWVVRDPALFGPPLLAPPRPKLVQVSTPAAEPAMAGDAIFADAATVVATPAAAVPGPTSTPPPEVAAGLFADPPAPAAAAVAAPTARQTAAVAAAKPRILPVP